MAGLVATPHSLTTAVPQAPWAATGFASLCPEGIDPPPTIPTDIFTAATATVLACRRLDMQCLAADLAIGRATLYRRAESRNRLLGEVLWFLTRLAMDRALIVTEGLSGPERLIEVIDRFLHDIHGQAALRHLLATEPEIALRILTSKRGPVQRGIAGVLERLIEQELGRDVGGTSIEPPTLAFVIVRIGESFLYSDVIAGHEADIAQAVNVIAVLIDAAASR